MNAKNRSACSTRGTIFRIEHHNTLAMPHGVRHCWHNMAAWRSARHYGMHRLGSHATKPDPHE
jgi:hypothetical protein